jgi:hypothetical protein
MGNQHVSQVSTIPSGFPGNKTKNNNTNETQLTRRPNHSEGKNFCVWSEIVFFRRGLKNGRTNVVIMVNWLRLRRWRCWLECFVRDERCRMIVVQANRSHAHLSVVAVPRFGRQFHSVHLACNQIQVGHVKLLGMGPNPSGRITHVIARKGIVSENCISRTALVVLVAIATTTQHEMFGFVVHDRFVLVLCGSRIPFRSRAKRELLLFRNHQSVPGADGRLRWKCRSHRRAAAACSAARQTGFRQRPKPRAAIHVDPRFQQGRPQGCREFLGSDALLDGLAVPSPVPGPGGKLRDLEAFQQRGFSGLGGAHDQQIQLGGRQVAIVNAVEQAEHNLGAGGWMNE